MQKTAESSLSTSLRMHVEKKLPKHQNGSVMGKYTNKIKLYYRQNSEPLIIGMILGVVALGSLVLLPKLLGAIFEETKKPLTINFGNHSDSDPFHRMSNRSLAQKLTQEVKILCWVLTGPNSHRLRADHIKNTWGRRCQYLLFMSSKRDIHLKSVPLRVKEGRDYLWQKTKQAMKYVYQRYYDKADWFFKADDDTYVIMENMRYFLKFQNSSEPVYFGCKFKPFVKQGYMSGGAGYVLSKEALKRFVKIALPNSKLCSNATIGGAEDVLVGRCLQNVGVKAGDSRDEKGRQRFLFLSLQAMLIPQRRPYWLYQYSYYPFTNTSIDQISDSLISIHYVSPEQIYQYEFLLYHVRPFGIAFNPTLDLPAINKTEVLEVTNTVKNADKEMSREEKELAWDAFN